MAPRVLIRGFVGPLVALLALLPSACGAGGPGFIAPHYLERQMRRFPPQSGRVTPYQTNGPRSLFVLSIAESENGFFLGTSGGDLSERRR